MSDVGLSTPDWINIAIAIGVAATAVFTAQAAWTSRLQARRYAPVVSHDLSKAERDGLWLLRARLIPADRERFMIAGLSVPLLSGARVIEAHYRHGPTGEMVPEPSAVRGRSVSFPAGWHEVAAFIEPGRAEEVTVRVHIASRAHSRARSRFTVRINTKDG